MRYAGVLAQYRGHIVLVREEYPTWGGVFWNIPSGRIEDHETPSQGACRELSEETGVYVSASALVLASTSAVTSSRGTSHAWNFTVEVDNPTLNVRDPDGLIQDARWFVFDEARTVLRQLPYRPLSEPALAILDGNVPVGTHWSYPSPGADPTVTAPT